MEENTLVKVVLLIDLGPRDFRPTLTWKNDGLTKPTDIENEKLNKSLSFSDKIKAIVLKILSTIHDECCKLMINMKWGFRFVNYSQSSELSEAVRTKQFQDYSFKSFEEFEEELYDILMKSCVKPSPLSIEKLEQRLKDLFLEFHWDQPDLSSPIKIVKRGRRRQASSHFWPPRNMCFLISPLPGTTEKLSYFLGDMMIYSEKYISDFLFGNAIVKNMFASLSLKFSWIDTNNSPSSDTSTFMQSLLQTAGSSILPSDSLFCLRTCIPLCNVLRMLTQSCKLQKPVNLPTVTLTWSKGLSCTLECTSITNADINLICKSGVIESLNMFCLSSIVSHSSFSSHQYLLSCTSDQSFARLLEKLRSDQLVMLCSVSADMFGVLQPVGRALTCFALLDDFSKMKEFVLPLPGNQVDAGQVDDCQINDSQADDSQVAAGQVAACQVAAGPVPVMESLESQPIGPSEVSAPKKELEEFNCAFVQESATHRLQTRGIALLYQRISSIPSDIDDANLMQGLQKHLKIASCVLTPSSKSIKMLVESPLQESPIQESNEAATCKFESENELLDELDYLYKSFMEGTGCVIAASKMMYDHVKAFHHLSLEDQERVIRKLLLTYKELKQKHQEENLPVDLQGREMRLQICLHLFSAGDDDSSSFCDAVARLLRSLSFLFEPSAACSFLIDELVPNFSTIPHLLRDVFDELAQPIPFNLSMLLSPEPVLDPITSPFPKLTKPTVASPQKGTQIDVLETDRLLRSQRSYCKPVVQPSRQRQISIPIRKVKKAVKSFKPTCHEAPSGCKIDKQIEATKVRRSLFNSQPGGVRLGRRQTVAIMQRKSPELHVPDTPDHKQGNFLRLRSQAALDCCVVRESPGKSVSPPSSLRLLRAKSCLQGSFRSSFYSEKSLVSQLGKLERRMSMSQVAGTTSSLEARSTPPRKIVPHKLFAKLAESCSPVQNHFERPIVPSLKRMRLVSPEKCDIPGGKAVNSVKFGGLSSPKVCQLSQSDATCTTNCNSSEPQGSRTRSRKKIVTALFQSP